MQTKERADLLSRLSNIDKENFERLALEAFRYQARYNPLYAAFIRLLKRDPEAVDALPDIPFLPVSFFKSHVIQSAEWAPETVFASSATTGQIPSRHWVRDRNLYLDNARRGFESFYGPVEEWCILALLPSYLERNGSSLVAMADDFIRRSKYPESGFFLRDFEKLNDVLQDCRRRKIPTLLLGVSFALLDFAEQYPVPLQGITIMETGGMKGRRRELTRRELHDTLCSAFTVDHIHSEYGMTELLSQAYALKEGCFQPAPTLKALCADLYDPLEILPAGKTGSLHLIDLANIDTCCFIAVEDLGRVRDDGSFEVLGRVDRAEIRGCNLMAEMTP